jgi:anthranilate/para-aminobenzoate synthase component I
MIPHHLTKEFHSAFYFKQRKKILVLFNPVFAFEYFGSQKRDLLSGKVSKSTPEQYYNSLGTIVQDSVLPRVSHLFYENRVYDIEYKDFLWIDLKSQKKEKKIKLKSRVDFEFKKYEKKFLKLREHLLRGDCYQVNLTENFSFDFSTNHQVSDFLDIFYNSSKLDSYAHHTYLPLKNWLLLSNSPESLFQITINNIQSYPIKGTSSKEDDPTGEILFNSLKDQSELYMISDLLRNDLARIDLPRAKIKIKKAKLELASLWQLYSMIEVEVDAKTSMAKVFKALFPGGSITGAPKIRSREIIKKLESRKRGAYTGSTYFSWKKLKASSINIRSAEIDFNQSRLDYGAGGGITLESKARSEYEEIILKLQSFLEIFK